jgi:hypothetical protein
LKRSRATQQHERNAAIASTTLRKRNASVIVPPNFELRTTDASARQKSLRVRAVFFPSDLPSILPVGTNNLHPAARPGADRHPEAVQLYDRGD